MKTSGCAWRIVSYIRRPPQSGLMPQPWPTVSADQATVTSRGAAGGRREAALRRLAPRAQIGQILEQHAIEDPLAGGRSVRTVRHVKSDASSAAGPRTRRASVKRSVVEYSTNIRAGAIRAAPDRRRGHRSTHRRRRRRTARPDASPARRRSPGACRAGDRRHRAAADRTEQVRQTERTVARQELAAIRSRPAAHACNRAGPCPDRAPPAGSAAVACVAARTTASAMTSAASAPIVACRARPSHVPVASEKIVSPSTRRVNRRRSPAHSRRLPSAPASAPAPSSAWRWSRPRRWSVLSPARPSRQRSGRMQHPRVGEASPSRSANAGDDLARGRIDDVADGLTATMAATMRPSGMRIAALPMPLFIDREPSRRTCRRSHRRRRRRCLPAPVRSSPPAAAR